MNIKTRLDTWLPQSRAGRQRPSLDHLGRGSEAKNCKKTKKVKCDGATDGLKDGPTDGQTDGPLDRLMDIPSEALTDGPSKWDAVA